MGINVNRGNRVAINGYFEDENGNKYSVLMKIALKAALEVRQSFNLSSYFQSLNASWEPLTLWSSDFHISPIADIKYLLQPVFEVEVNSSKRDVVKMKVSIIDKSLSGHCHLTNTCQRDLEVLTKENGLELSPCPNKLREAFYRVYRAPDSQLMAADAVLCNHAVSLCEIFMPFDKPMVVIASTRYEVGRWDASSWTRWNNNLQRIAARPENTIAANNLYDLEYMKYFTGLKNIILLPNFCGYVNATYSYPSLASSSGSSIDGGSIWENVLIAPSRGVNEDLLTDLRAALHRFNVQKNTASRPLRLAGIRELYPGHYEYAALARHPAAVLLPYQVSVMSFFEYYRMGLPMFVPSPQLLAEWHMKYRVLNERTWMSVHGSPSSRSLLSRHPNSSSLMISDPNDEFSEAAVLEWISLADFYVWPHITQFSSWDDLLSKLSSSLSPSSTNLRRISQSMQLFNRQEDARIRSQWLGILSKIRTYKAQHLHPSPLPMDINEALGQAYGLALDKKNCNRQVELPSFPG
eukprot:gene31266-40635_t